MDLGITLLLLAAAILVLSFVLSSVICTIVVARRNASRDAYHQISIVKGFLYALFWTPVILAYVLMILAMFDWVHRL
jgi:uncharacterized membrane protein YozB (DUF420 family)